MQDPSVTIILLTWNSRQDIDECLISMLRQDYSNYHILIVDSCSTDGTPEYIRTKYPELELVEMHLTAPPPPGQKFWKIRGGGQLTSSLLMPPLILLERTRFSL